MYSIKNGYGIGSGYGHGSGSGYGYGYGYGNGYGNGDGNGYGNGNGDGNSNGSGELPAEYLCSHLPGEADLVAAAGFIYSLKGDSPCPEMAHSTMK